MLQVPQEESDKHEKTHAKKGTTFLCVLTFGASCLLTWLGTQKRYNLITTVIKFKKIKKSRQVSHDCHFKMRSNHAIICVHNTYQFITALLIGIVSLFNKMKKLMLFFHLFIFKHKIPICLLIYARLHKFSCIAMQWVLKVIDKKKSDNDD